MPPWNRRAPPARSSYDQPWFAVAIPRRAGLSSPAESRARRESMSVRLGISPIGWSNDDLLELGGDTPLDTCLAEAREAGFEGIELGHKFPRDPALLQPLLAHQALRLISGWYSGRLLERSVTEELEAIEPHRALLAAMGCAVLVHAETTD